eukprot:2379360-Amphidinium_carterae.2
MHIAVISVLMFSKRSRGLGVAVHVCPRRPRLPIGAGSRYGCHVFTSFTDKLHIRVHCDQTQRIISLRSECKS